MDCPECDRGILKADPETQDTAGRSGRRYVGSLYTENSWICIRCGTSFERSDL